MLTRQKVVLALLEKVGRPVSPTVFVKLTFLLRHETALRDDPAFYDFVPYMFGPFSFLLYRELDGLRAHGFVSPDEKRIGLRLGTQNSSSRDLRRLASESSSALAAVIARYGKMRQHELVKSVYSRYPWYATKSENVDLVRRNVPKVRPAPNAVYTVGYEGKSVDSFFDDLLKAGIRAILDVRKNPVSRKYGFAKESLHAIAGKLGIEYHHFPELGIPGTERVALHDYDAYQRLFERYERELLPRRLDHVYGLVDLLRKSPSALLCVEKDADYCHRGRLARAATILTGLPTVHL
jgi:uncharacterized protein (DUF488 family)